LGFGFNRFAASQESTAALQDCIEAHSDTVRKTVSSTPDFLLFGDEICTPKFNLVRPGQQAGGACTALHSTSRSALAAGLRLGLAPSEGV